jgi:pimeloyl-ACP methyl ester carboxylesterase
MKSVLPVLLALAACGSPAAQAPSPMPAFFENAGARLAFSLDLPEGRGPFPAVVLGHGSGKTTRDQLRWAADRFVAMGFAVLRFDKRGVGESTGTYVFVGYRDSEEVFPVLAGDIAAGVRFLRTRPEIDAKRIGLAGNSQAGWLLPLAASQVEVSFMVLMAGPVCTVGQEWFYSDMVENDPSASIADANHKMPEYNGQQGFDPMPVLRSLNVPALWLLGTEDRSIPVELTLHNLQALKSAGKPFEWRTYPGAGHSLTPQMWDDIGPWVAKFR